MAVEEAPSDAPTPPPAGKGGLKIGKKQVKNEHVLIIIGVLTLFLTYVFLKRSEAAQAANSSGTTTVQSAVPQTSTDPTDNPTYDSDFSQIAADLQQMQSEITGLSTPTVSTTPVSPTTTPPVSSTPIQTAPTGANPTSVAPEVMQGYGYWGGSDASTAPVQSAAGGVYDLITSWTQAQQLNDENVAVDYQPTPGVFSPAFGSNGQLVPQLQTPGNNTPLFQLA